MTESASGPSERISGARDAIRSPRAAAVAGIAFALIMAGAFVLIRLATGTGPGDDNWVSDDAKRGTVSFAVNLLPFAGIAFLWFVGVVRDRIGSREDRLFATVFLGSGLLFVAMLFATGAVAGGLLLSGIDPDVWSFGREVTFNLLLVYAMRMAAVFTLSTTMLLTRLQLVPRWLALWGLVTAVILLFGAGRITWVEVTFPLWVLVISTHLLHVTYSRSHRETGERT